MYSLDMSLPVTRPEDPKIPWSDSETQKNMQFMTSFGRDDNVTFLKVVLNHPCLTIKQYQLDLLSP
jgi:hypothetical protein